LESSPGPCVMEAREVSFLQNFHLEATDLKGLNSFSMAHNMP